MREITPHLWFDKEAGEAARFYTSTFADSKITSSSMLHDTPSGDAEVVAFELFGQPFMATSAGPEFKFNPSISFLVSCQTTEEVDDLWSKLSEGGTALMALDTYPFSKRYGWTQDRYGLSWQVMAAEEPQIRQRITPTLMYVGDVSGKAEDAVNFYTSVFPKSNIGDISRYGKGEEPEEEGTVRHVGFSLNGQQFAAMDSAREHDFNFNEAISFMVLCEDQKEIDRYWEALSAVPEAEQCGWLKDKYGVSWQVTPADLESKLRDGTKEQTKRVTEAFLKMKKFDLAELQRAYEGS